MYSFRNNISEYTYVNTISKRIEFLTIFWLNHSHISSIERIKKMNLKEKFPKNTKWNFFNEILYFRSYLLTRKLSNFFPTNSFCMQIFNKKNRRRKIYTCDFFEYGKEKNSATFSHENIVFTTFMVRHEWIVLFANVYLCENII